MATVSRETRLLIYLSQEEFSGLMKCLDVASRSKDLGTRVAAKKLAKELHVILGPEKADRSDST
jgi:hypothetical protein